VIRDEKMRRKDNNNSSNILKKRKKRRRKTITTTNTDRASLLVEKLKGAGHLEGHPDKIKIHIFSFPVKS